MKRLQRLYALMRTRHCQSPPFTLQAIRECVLFWLLFFGAFVGIVGYLPGMYGAWKNGLYDIAVIDTLFYGWIIYLFLAPRLSYRFRAFGFIVPLWVLAIFLIVRVGAGGAGFLWLFVAPILTGTLIGRKEGVFSVVLAVAVMIVTGWFMHAAPIPVQTTLSSNQGLKFWAIITGNMALLMVLVFASTAVMIEALYQTIRRLESKLLELSKTKDATIEAIASLAEYRDSDTGYHIYRTKAFVRQIAKALQAHGYEADVLTDEYIDTLAKSAPLHDIGKIGIPDAILLKQGPLTPEEMEEMKQHTVYGYEALMRAAKSLGDEHFLTVAAEIAYTHQERWDGSGYPRGLKGKAIPLSGRIMAVADVYDALRSRRPYKAPMSHEEAMAYLYANANKQFDPDIIAILPDIEASLQRIYARMADDVTATERLDTLN